MEEKVVGGKEKKYVLYTVVGEERGRAGAGVWVVRVLLGTLLLVALAVVPYLSLRLAQVSDRTLVVFQPVPIRNQSLQHHHGDHDHHAIEHSKLGPVNVVSVLKSASLTLENYNATSNGTAKSQAAKLNSNSSSSTNSSKSSSSSNNSSSSSSNTKNSNSSSGAMVTLHESTVTLAVMEDTNATKKKENSTDGENSEHEEGSSEKTALEEAEKKEPEENTTTEDTAGTSESPASVAQVAVVTVDANPSTPPATLDNTTASANTTVAPKHESNATSAAPVTSTAAASVAPSSASAPGTPETSDKASTAKSSNVSSVTSTVAPNTTTTTTTKASTSTRRPLAHKLVYVATTASGNHVGGFCVWKTDKTITRWSYFYENIPIEYQSHQDSSDHEMRGMLAAVRTWAPLWNDHHVVLRSHHPSIKGSDHPTRMALSRELERLSEGKFSYELEWRLRKTDRVVDIAYCLSRLHRDFAQWYRTFEARVDELLGQQDWTVAREQNRVPVSQDAFLTDDPDDEGVIIPGDK